MKQAIETGDESLLRTLLAEDPSLANTLIEWGKDCHLRTHPLHYVSDMLFGGTLARGKETQLIAALIAAGADCNHQASNGETPLIGAASLVAETVGLQLLAAGALPDLKGAFKETALHWAAYVGLHRLVKALVEKGADVNVKDTRYHSTPVGWAIHGCYSASAGSDGRHHEVVALLVHAGATLEPAWLLDERVSADPLMAAALRTDQPT